MKMAVFIGLQGYRSQRHRGDDCSTGIDKERGQL